MVSKENSRYSLLNVKKCINIFHTILVKREKAGHSLLDADQQFDKSELIRMT